MLCSLEFSPYSTSTRFWPYWSLRFLGLSISLISPSTMKATRSHSSSAIYMLWVVRNMVTPFSFSSRMMSLMTEAMAGSSPVVGSSRNHSSGVVNHGTGEGEPVLHSLGELLGPDIALAVQSDQFQQFLRDFWWERRTASHRISDSHGPSSCCRHWTARTTCRCGLNIFRLISFTS